MYHETPPYESFTLAPGSFSYSNMGYTDLRIYGKDHQLLALFKCDSADTVFRIHKALMDAIHGEEPAPSQEELDEIERAYEAMLEKEMAECEDDGYGACGYKCDGRCQQCGSGGFDMADEI